MSLFKILHGDEERISLDITPFHEGWCYVTHNGRFYVDMNIGTKESPNYQRVETTSRSAYQYAQDGGFEGTEEEFAEKMGIDILEEITYNTITNNLFDGELEYGWIDENDGSNIDYFNPITVSCRTKNYIEVEGGKNLTFNILDGQSVKIVQYNVNKEFISFLTLEKQVNKYDTGKYLTLDANTRYVRLAMWGEVDLTAFKLNLYYIEHTDEMWSGAGDVFKEVPHFMKERIGDYIIPERIPSSLTAKKIVYDGDSICMGLSGGGGYAQLIADKVGGKFVNASMGGGRLITQSGSTDDFHSIVDNLVNLPTDGDLYCFEGGINDFWTKGVLGTFDYANFDGELDTTTMCGALETIFRYALTNFVGKPICFVITHKIQGTAYGKNSNGDTFKDYHDAMVGICQKYSIPFYDAFYESGLNGWNTAQNNAYLTGNSAGTPDGCHPNEQGYRRYYVPQLINLFEKIMPIGATEPEVPVKPNYVNINWKSLYDTGLMRSQWLTDISQFQNDYDSKFNITATDTELTSEPKGGGDDRLYYSTKMYEITSDTRYEYTFEAKNDRAGYYAGVIFAYDITGKFPYLAFGEFDNSVNGTNCIYYRRGHFDELIYDCIVNQGDLFNVKVNETNDGYGQYKVIYEGLNVKFCYLNTSGEYVQLGNPITLPEGSKVCVGVYSPVNQYIGGECCTVSLRNCVLTAKNDVTVDCLAGQYISLAQD